MSPSARIARPLNLQAAAEQPSRSPRDTGSEHEREGQEESCDYGCIRRPPMDSSPPTAAELTDERQENRAAPGGANEVEPVPTASAAVAGVVSESDKEEGSDLGEQPTDEQLREAIRGIPASVDDISQLSLKQVEIYNDFVSLLCTWCTCRCKVNCRPVSAYFVGGPHFAKHFLTKPEGWWSTLFQNIYITVIRI